MDSGSEQDQGATLLSSTEPEEPCSGCRAPLQGKSHYEVRTEQAPTTKCLKCALLHPPMLWRSAKIALVVGSFLVALNQGDKLLALTEGMAAEELLWKVPLTYCVPFCVATYGALGNAQR